MTLTKVHWFPKPNHRLDESPDAYFAALDYVHLSSTPTTSVAHKFISVLFVRKRCGADSHAQSHKTQFGLSSMHTNHADNIL